MNEDENEMTDEQYAAAMEACEVVMAAMVSEVDRGRHPLAILVWEPLLRMIASVAGDKLGFALLFASDKLDAEKNCAIVSVPVGVARAEVETVLRNIIEDFAPFVDRDETIIELEAGWTKCENCVEAHPIIRRVVVHSRYLVTYSEAEENEVDDTGEVKDYMPPGRN